tara:strand:- start:5 stop:178 length:174 start_codon:yes stop_codon:yes gene_type:complete
MNSWPGPENSWEGVDAYFTWANNAGLLTTFVVIVAAICIGVIYAAARHESEIADKHK